MKTIEERIDDIMTADGISLKSFEIKNDLNRIFWDRRNDNKLMPEIRAAVSDDAMLAWIPEPSPSDKTICTSS